MVCPCKYPLHIIDKRDDDEIEYLAFPDEYIDDVDGEVDVPKFEVVEESGETFMAVLWHEPDDAITKRYNVAGHIVIAGCEAKVDEDGKKIKCKKKELFVVLHPIDEWQEHHVVELD